MPHADEKLQALEEKIRRARDGETLSPEEARKKAEDENARAGIHAGFEFVGSIVISAAVGYGLDSWLGTKPAFFITLFFLGIFTGFYNVYRVTQNLGTTVGVSRLHQDKKNAKRAPEKEKQGTDSLKE